MALTTKGIARALKTPGRYFDEHGLYLQVVSPTNASWVLRYERDGRARMMGLGPVRIISLKQARERARMQQIKLLDGIDPLEAKKAAKAARALEAAKAMTFESAARKYFEQNEHKWKNAKHRNQFLSTLEAYAFPQIGKISVAAIDQGLVLKCIDPIWQDT